MENESSQPGTKRSADSSDDPRKQFKPEPAEAGAEDGQEPEEFTSVASPASPSYQPLSGCQGGVMSYQGSWWGEVDRLEVMLRSLEEDIIRDLPADEGMLREFPHLGAQERVREARRLAHTILNGIYDEREEWRARGVLQADRPDWYRAKERLLASALASEGKEKKEKKGEEGEKAEGGEVRWSSGVVVAPAPQAVQEEIPQPQPSCSYSVRYADHF